MSDDHIRCDTAHSIREIGRISLLNRLQIRRHLVFKKALFDQLLCRLDDPRLTVPLHDLPSSAFFRQALSLSAITHSIPEKIERNMEHTPTAETNVLPGTSTPPKTSSKIQTGRSSSMNTPQFSILSSPSGWKYLPSTHCNGTRFVGAFSSSRRSKARLIWKTNPERTSPVAWISTPRSGWWWERMKYAQWSAKGEPL